MCRLHEERGGEDIEVAVVYGAAHLPVIVRGLMNRYGYRPRSADWADHRRRVTGPVNETDWSILSRSGTGCSRVQSKRAAQRPDESALREPAGAVLARSRAETLVMRFGSLAVVDDELPLADAYP